MILLNYSHPLTPDQLAQLEALAGQAIERRIEIMAQFDHARPFAEQAAELADRAGLSAAEWQTAAIIVNLPSYNFAAAALLAHLHGRMGYFPAIVRLRPIAGATPPRFEVAEIINLQDVRESGRQER